MSDFTLSLIIPAYNEAARIGQTLADCAAYLADQPYASEIIVVDDGSSDGTGRVIERDYPAVHVIRYEANRGKGHAVKMGMLAARGDYRLFYDADGSTPIAEIEKAWPLMENGTDIVIGSRSLPDSDIAVRQPWYRQNMGRIYNGLLRILQLTRFPDTQCGFKVMNKASAGSVMPLITCEGFGMDVEMLAVAERQGYRIEQVPVRWLNSEDSRVRVLRDSLRMIGEVLMVRWNLMTGRYR